MQTAIATQQATIDMNNIGNLFDLAARIDHMCSDEFESMKHYVEQVADGWLPFWKQPPPPLLKLRCKTFLAYDENEGVLGVTRLNANDSTQRISVYRNYSEHSQARFERLLACDCWYQEPAEYKQTNPDMELYTKEVEFYWYEGDM